MVRAQGSDDGEEPSGFLVAPGDYTVSLSKRVRGETTELVEAQPFTVERFRDGALPPQEDAVEFWDDVAKFNRQITAAGASLAALDEKVNLLQIATQRVTGGDPETLDDSWQAIRTEVNELDALMNGNPARIAIYERTIPTVRSRLGSVLTGLRNSTYGPTQTHREQFDYAHEEFEDIRARLTTLADTTIPEFEAELIEAGGPWVAGGKIP